MGICFFPIFTSTWMWKYHSLVERVDGGDVTVGRVLFDHRHTPCIIGVSCNCLRILVNDSNDITLQVLDEVIGNGVIENPANAILVIIERNKRVFSPSLTENLSAVKRVGMKNTIYFFARSDAVCIVGILNVIKLLELPSLFPSQSMSEIGCREL